MQVVVIHRLSDPDGFYSTVEEALKDGPPEGLQLPAQARGTDGRTHVCIWEAPSVDAVRDAVEGLVGQYSDNEYIEAEVQGLATSAA